MDQETLVSLSAHLPNGVRVSIDIAQPASGDRGTDEAVAVYNARAAVTALAASANVDLPKDE